MDLVKMVVGVVKGKAIGAVVGVRDLVVVFVSRVRDLVVDLVVDLKAVVIDPLKALLDALKG